MLRDVLTLDELWIAPTDPTKFFEMRPATAANLDAASATYDDASMYVGTGWRGPYLTLGAGSTRLRDGFGTPLESPATTSPDFARSFLRTASDAAIGVENTPIETVRPGGANALIIVGDTGLNADTPVLDLRNSSMALLKANVTVKLGSTLSAPLGAGTKFRIQIRVYQPSPTDVGKIQANVATDTFESTATAGGSYSAQMNVPNLTVGNRTLRAYLVDSTTPTTKLLSSKIRRTILRPGTNDCSLEIEVEN